MGKTTMVLYREPSTTIKYVQRLLAATPHPYDPQVSRAIIGIMQPTLRSIYDAPTPPSAPRIPAPV